jgi:hypothetical protein
MDDVLVFLSKKSASGAGNVQRTVELKERLERLLREAAEVAVELNRADSTIRGIPHYSVIEGRAHELGQQLSRAVQRREMNELVASQPQTGKCPTCGTRCELQACQRDVKSVDGTFRMQELVGHCPCCRRDFFPAA